MIRVTVEILRFGSEADRKVLHVIDIANKGTGVDDLNRTSYAYRIDRQEWRGDIKHVRMLGVLPLLRRVMTALGRAK